MALVDDPKAFILRMFQMEQNEGRAEHCKVFPSGIRPHGIELHTNEMVYGIYKNKYYITPTSLIIVSNGEAQQIEWGKIKNCSTQHGDGNKTSLLTLVDGSVVELKTSELAIGWAGRISQLIHKMIERWGINHASSGLPLMSIEDYFYNAKSKDSFAPNLKPHPELIDIKSFLLEFRSNSDIADVLIEPMEYEGSEPIARRIVIIAKTEMPALDALLNQLAATHIGLASENILKKLENTNNKNAYIFEVVWD